jgi:3-oxoacyl-[acyl-carrier protein] reductase
MTPPRTAIVTGGTRGIGLGIARALAAEGWRLVVTGVRPASDVTGVVDELTALGAETHYCASDIAVAADRARLVDEAVARFGGIDALVNNAGRAPAVRADILEATEDSFTSLVTTNLQGPYFLTQLVARHMLAREATPAAGPAAPEPSSIAPAAAGIVFVTSVSAELASIQRGDYCVSKAGLAMAARLFAVRLAPHAIPVYEVRPGIIATDMTARVKDVYDRRIADGLVPEGRWGTPVDVGRVVAALLRGDAPYATGSVVHVDGGLALGRL